MGLSLPCLVESDDGELYSFKEDAIRLVVFDEMSEGIKRVIYNAIISSKQEGGI